LGYGGFLVLLFVCFSTQAGQIQQVQSGRAVSQRNVSLESLQATGVYDCVYNSSKLFQGPL
jgi:hypothetical protein